MGRVAYCKKCDSRHQRPVGRRCELFRTMAASSQSQDNGEASISNSISDIETSQPGTSNPEPQLGQHMGNALVLAELRALASRLDRFEAESNTSQSDTRTSTPRGKKKVKKNQGNARIINSQFSLNESVIPVTITSARTTSMAVSRAIDVTAGVATTTMAATMATSATPITAVPLVGPPSTTLLVAGTTGTGLSTVSSHMQLPPVGVPVVSYSVHTTPGLGLSVGGQTVMTGSRMSAGLPQPVVCTATLNNYPTVSYPQQGSGYSHVLPPPQAGHSEVLTGGGTSMAEIQGLTASHNAHINFSGTGMTSMAINPGVPQTTAPYHMSTYGPPISHAAPLQSFQQLPMSVPMSQQPQEEGLQQQSMGLPTLNTLRSSAVDQQLIQERLQAIKTGLSSSAPW